jgi:MFS family permease
LALSIFAVNFARFSLGILQEPLSKNLAFSDRGMSLIQGTAIAVPMMLAAIPISVAFKGRRLGMVFSTCVFLCLAANLTIATVSNYQLIFVARMLIGLAMAFVLVTPYALGASLYSEAHRGRASMVLTIGEISGGPAAFALGGFLFAGMAASSVPSHPEQWRSVLLWMCLPLVPIALMMLAILDPPARNSRQAPFAFSDVWRVLLVNRRVAGPLLVSRIMVWVADGAVLVWGAPMMTRRYGLSAAEVGALMGAALLVSGVVGPLVGGLISDLCQRRGGPRSTATMLCVLTALSIPASLFALAPSPFLSIAGLTLLLAIGFALNVMAIAVSSVVLPADVHSAYFAVMCTVGSGVGLGIAPLTVSATSALLGGSSKIDVALALVCTCMSVLGCASFAWARRYFPTHAASR